MVDANWWMKERKVKVDVLIGALRLIAEYLVICMLTARCGE